MIAENGKIILFILCLLLSAFFSGSEVALISINQAKVRTLLEQHRKGAKALESLKQNTDHLLITILIGNNVVNVAAAALATSIAIERYGDIGVGIATGVVTILMLIFGEIGPKTYATRYIEGFALFSSRMILALSYILTPVLWLNDLFKRLLAIEKLSYPPITEEEIKQWIDVGEEAGTIEEEEHEMLYRVFRFTDTKAREIMTPRADVVMIDESASLEEAINIFNETGYSRIPIYRDHIDEIIGVLNVKDVFAAVYGEKAGFLIPDLAYEAYFVPESKKIDDLLNDLQVRKVHMALVLDEYGTYAGIVTVEDILEELVGEIIDEFDRELPQIRRMEDGSYVVDARSWVDRVNDVLGISLPLDEAYETIGGLLIDRLGHIPRRGEVVEVGDTGIHLMVIKMRGKSVMEVRLTLPPATAVDNG